MRKEKIINMIKTMSLNSLEENRLFEYTKLNIEELNKYESLYPVIGDSGNIYLKYIPSSEEYIEFENKNKNYMNLEAIKLNRIKYNIV